MESGTAGKKKLRDLRKGDIVYMGIPFEENTPDYYNGYNPKEIRGGHLYRNKEGLTGKSRCIVVIGRDENNVMYLPLTSRHHGFDSRHQYRLKDNSMTYKKDPDMKSYVEVDSLRAVYASPEWNIKYVGRIVENDMANIMVLLGRRDIDFESKRDQRVYVSRNKEETFERNLKDNGYVLSGEGFEEKTYSNENGRTVIKSRWGLVKYHVPLSKEEVIELVAKRENKSAEDITRAEIKYEIKPVDDFTSAITDMTEKSVKEREAI